MCRLMFLRPRHVLAAIMRHDLNHRVKGKRMLRDLLTGPCSVLRLTGWVPPRCRETCAGTRLDLDVYYRGSSNGTICFRVSRQRPSVVPSTTYLSGLSRATPGRGFSNIQQAEYPNVYMPIMQVLISSGLFISYPVNWSSSSWQVIKFHDFWK